jgi:hypothetical protein
MPDISNFNSMKVLIYAKEQKEIKDMMSEL